MKNKKGFTLIELLVVISILGILASFVIASMSGAQKQARDSQRKSDLNQYRNGLEAYAASNNGLYPAAVTSNYATNLSTALASYMSAFPSDPISTVYYYYDPSADLTRYILYADLETSTSYWYICSTGKLGTKATAPTDADCP